MSKQSISLLSLTGRADGDITAHRFVNHEFNQAEDDESTIGVARSSVMLGDQFAIDVLGTTVVEAGAAISKGMALKSNVAGKAIPWSRSGARVAVALENAAGDGSFIEVLLIPNGNDN